MTLSTVRSTIGTGSPQVGMMMPTSGTSGPVSGRNGVIRLRQPLTIDSSRHIAENTLAAANGPASHIRSVARWVNIHGR